MNYLLYILYILLVMPWIPVIQGRKHTVLFRPTHTVEHIENCTFAVNQDGFY